MGLGSKIRGVVNTIGQKSKLISKLGHKGAGVVGLFDKSAGKDLNQVADIADKVGASNGSSPDPIIMAITLQ